MKVTNGYCAGSWARIEANDNLLDYRWREYDYNGNIVAQRGEFTAAEDAAAERIIKSLPRPAHRVDDIYIRFGALPKGGKSRNWASGKYEDGVSVYRARYNVSTGTYQAWGALPGAEIAHLMRGSKIWLVTGDKVGTGSDGEPLLSNIISIHIPRAGDDSKYAQIIIYYCSNNLSIS